MPISSTGVILEPSTTAITYAQNILINTYGASVNLDPSSPNGLLVQNIALAITYRENAQANVVNSLNPNIATGTQLDAICANLNIQRSPATNSTATVQITGLAGVTIPNLTQVSSTNNDIFLINGPLTIGGGGTIIGTVTAQSSGPVAVAANTITTIINGINGWDTINNSGAGNVGTVVQSDTGLRQTRIAQLAFASSGSLVSILAGAQALEPPPTSIYLTQNTTSSPVTIDGITIAANSILLVLDGGGSETTIAEMLFQRLSAGCGMSGNTSFTIPIPNSSQTFTATWQTATEEVLSLVITIKTGDIFPSNLVDLITSAVNTNFNFNVIGQFIYANEFTNILYANGIFPIINLTFGVGSSLGLNVYTMPINQSLGASLLSSNVSLVYV